MTDLPGVGENLQDHLEVYIQYASKLPVSIAPGLRWRARPRIAYEWLFHRRGLGATNHFEGGGFVRSNDEVDYPNLMFHFLPVAIRYDGTSPTKGHGYQVHIGPMYADTRGYVKIRSTDPREHPSMLFNYLSTANDRREWVEAIRVARDILSQPAFGRSTTASSRPAPGSSPTTRSSTGSGATPRPRCTPPARPGWGGDDAVVDPAHACACTALEGLRVVDASVFPYVTNGNIYAPVMMVAEKAADLIAGRTPLAAGRGARTTATATTRPSIPPGDQRNDVATDGPDSELPDHPGGRPMTAPTTEASPVAPSQAPRPPLKVEGLWKIFGGQRRQDHRHRGRRALAQGAAGEDRLRHRRQGRLLRGGPGRGVRRDGTVRVRASRPWSGC